MEGVAFRWGEETSEQNSAAIQNLPTLLPRAVGMAETLGWGGDSTKKKFYFEDYRNRAMTPLGFRFHQSKDLWRAWE